MEYHVSIQGDDANDGSWRSPLCTIREAARRAQPGDVIIVHEGTYREWVNPPQGGESEEKRIVYQAAEGERVVIKGSEVIRGWERLDGAVWKVTLPNTFFGSYNPYADLIRGDWFDPKGRQHHTGQVYLNEQGLSEAATLEQVMDAGADELIWYGLVDDETTTIWARFPGIDPNRETVEINVRPAVFYPDRPGRNYITVRGFIMRHAATQWAPPTTEQIGLLGTHWSKGWIIEDNVISDSRCAGITLGKFGRSVDDTGATAERYNETIREALRNGWQKGTIGGHIVRNNTIYRCGQAGIVGSMGAAFSEVSGNHVHHIHVERVFGGAEMAGIKFHGAVDTVIRNNRIHHTVLGIWLDWMTQGTRVTGNLLYANDRDLFVEVSHGPYLVDNNLFLSKDSLLNVSQGGAFAHNLFGGKIVQWPDVTRQTPYHREHSTEVAGLINTRGGDDRFYNNIFFGQSGLESYDEPYEEWVYNYAQAHGLGDDWIRERLELWNAIEGVKPFPVWMGGNVYFGDARPSQQDRESQRVAEPLDVAVEDEGDVVRLRIKIGGNRVSVGYAAVLSGKKRVTTELLGKAAVPGVPYNLPDGSDLVIDTDYLGEKRPGETVVAGPLNRLSTVDAGALELVVWSPERGRKSNEQLSAG